MIGSFPNGKNTQTNKQTKTEDKEKKKETRFLVDDVTWRWKREDQRRGRARWSHKTGEKRTIENNAFAVIWGLQSNKEMDGRQKPNERKQKKKNEMAEFQTPSNSFSSKIYERQDDKNKVEAFKKNSRSPFSRETCTHKKFTKIFVFFWCPVSFLVGCPEPLDLLKPFYSIMWPI